MGKGEGSETNNITENHESYYITILTLYTICVCAYIVILKTIGNHIVMNVTLCTVYISVCVCT